MVNMNNSKNSKKNKVTGKKNKATGKNIDYGHSSPAENKIVSPFMSNRFDLWLWDFDDTLIDSNTYYKNKMKPELILGRSNSELDIEFPCWKYFKKLVPLLVSRGIRVGIVSFGTYAIIQAYMDRVFGPSQKYFTKNNILAPCRDDNGRIMDDITNKNNYIRRLMKYYRVGDYQKVILFDDRIENVADATLLDVVAVKIPGKDATSISGIGQYFCLDILKKVESDLKGFCDKHNGGFSSIGSRKSGIRTKNKKNLIEGFKCSCSNNKGVISLMILIFIMIFSLYFLDIFLH